jgi:hypothetical protein
MRNKFFPFEAKTSLKRHSGENRNLGILKSLGKLWNPAFAGVTAIRVLGFCGPL